MLYEVIYRKNNFNVGLRMKKVVFLVVLVLQLMGHLKADTVVGVHGFLATIRDLRPIEEPLACAGYDVILWEYNSRKKYIHEHACDLVRVLQGIACQCPGAPIHFVTHSVGGLVVRAALNLPSCPEEAKIGKAVLIAPPNQGSSLARRFKNVPPINFAMGSRSGWQLMHLNPCQIASCVGQFPPTMQVLVIAGTQGNFFLLKGPNDGFVTLEETWLNTPFNFLSFPLSHSDLLRASVVLSRMLAFLQSCEPNLLVKQKTSEKRSSDEVVCR